MIDAISLPNLVSYSLQVSLVVLAAALAAAVFRLDAAHARYAFWRGVALLCLALPLMQPRIPRMPRINAEEVGAVIDALVVQPAIGSLGTPGHALPIFEWSLGIVALGIVGRLAWVGGGLLKLRGLRRASHVAGADDEHADLQQIVGTRAEVRYVDGLRQPVTFGVVRPVVLLPTHLRESPERVRRAVLAHELLHVARRDWAWVLVEEVVRAGLWFHPGVWWLVSRVQLAREEVVDEMAVLVTGHRRAYVEALLAFADETPLAPAPAFARRRHLFRRMLLVSKEGTMSARQIVASCAVMAGMVAGGGWYAARAFPLVDAQQAHEMSFSPKPRDERGPLERAAKPITPENPIPRRVSVTQAEYPAEAVMAEATAMVSVRITLDESGRVAEARVETFDVHGPQTTDGSRGTTELDGPAARRLEEAFTASALAAVRQWRYEPPYDAPISFPVRISFRLGETESRQAVPPPPPPPPPPASGGHPAMGSGWTADGALRVGGRIKTPNKIAHVDPVYPPIAKAAGVEGVVILEARIGTDGRISDAHVLRSIPLLDEAALDAVKQWVFEPTLLNGERVPVVMILTINFSLARDAHVANSTTTGA